MSEKKRKVNPPKLNEAQTRDFIERVQANEVLWDNTLKDYFDKTKTDPIWVQIMEAMGIEGHTSKYLFSININFE